MTCRRNDCFEFIGLLDGIRRNYFRGFLELYFFDEFRIGVVLRSLFQSKCWIGDVYYFLIGWIYFSYYCSPLRVLFLGYFGYFV